MSSIRIGSDAMVSLFFRTMKKPTHHYHIRVKLDECKEPLDVSLFLNAKSRSKRGALTVHAFDVQINGKTIVAWATAAALRKANGRDEGRAGSALPKTL